MIDNIIFSTSSIYYKSLLRFRLIIQQFITLSTNSYKINAFTAVSQFMIKITKPYHECKVGHKNTFCKVNLVKHCSRCN